MVVEISGYQIAESLRLEGRTAIYRAVRQQDKKRVVIKALTAANPSKEEIARFKQECHITQNIDLPSAVKCYSLEHHDRSLALVLEDISGQSLQEVANDTKLSLKDLLQIAITIVETLAELHKLPIIHKDIKPGNIIVNRDTGQVQIIDFGIAVHVPVESPKLCEPSEIEGTIAYMSPEQTGRTSRLLDYRTDYYSLGVTCYELLTGSLPFSSENEIKVIYGHLAEDPIAPHQLLPEIPEVVSSIVMKLLEKNAEDRYQTAIGLKFDLETCLKQLEKNGKIDSFPLAKRDKGRQLAIPRKLYGRESEIELLRSAFDRICRGTSEVIMITGDSGNGKSSIAREITQYTIQSGGYFISGKFEELEQNIPYGAISQAFAELICLILTESSEKVEIWKQKLLQAFGQQGRVIADVVPEVELMLGPQPELLKLGAVENENRFKILFQRFLEVFCQEEHPIVLFLDDLQWADSASLKFIEMMATNWNLGHLLILGTYRDSTVTSDRSIFQTLDKITAAGATVNSIAIAPLKLFQVRQLVSETLYEDDALVQQKYTMPLADLLFNKTQGNPFLLTQLLKTLYSEELLIYSPVHNAWYWDITDIQAVGITDCNAVNLITRNIVKLPETTQAILKLAACIGSYFDLESLAIVSEASIDTTVVELWEALQAGLILPVSSTRKNPSIDLKNSLVTDNSKEQKSTDTNSQLVISSSQISYKFLHDRVQQAVYDLIPDNDKKATHLKLGQLLLANTTPEQRKNQIFTLVKQLNFAIDLLDTQAQKDELTQLNLIAAQRAKAATAYAVAANYLNAGLDILNPPRPAGETLESSWIRTYELTIEVYVEAVETEYLNTNFARSHFLTEVVLHEAKTLLEKVKVYAVKIKCYFSQSQMQTAIDTGLKVLAMLECSLEQEPPSSVVTVEDLANLPEMTDASKLAAQQILNAVGVSAFVTNPALFGAIVFTKVHLCIKYGNSPLAAKAYADYAMLLCGSTESIDAGYCYGELALQLLDKFNAKEVRCQVLNMFNTHIKPWKEPLRKTIEPLSAAVQSGIETGDLIFMGLASINYCTHTFFLGEPLEQLANNCEQYLSLAVKYQQGYTLTFLQLFQQVYLNLLGRSTSPVDLIGPAFDESNLLPTLKKDNNLVAMFFVYVYKAMLLYLFKDASQAVDIAAIAEEYANAIPGLLVIAQHNFYYSLALLAEYPNLDATKQSEYLKKVNSLQKSMKQWALHAPSNFQHKYDLVEAEKARVLGQNESAIDYYDLAIQGAADSGYIQEEAIASELAFEFHLARGRNRIAKFYLKEACYCYSRWGAQAKIKDLELRYTHLFPNKPIQPDKVAGFDSNRKISSTTGNIGLGSVDFISFMQASQAISGEIVLRELVHKLLKIAIENAGAQKGCLLLVDSGKLAIVATGKVAGSEINVVPFEPVEMSSIVPVGLLNYVWRTQQSLVLNDARCDSKFANEPYIASQQLRSILSVPIVNQGKVIGLLYLENNLAPGMFSPARLEVLKLLASQAATSIENACLIHDLETAKQTLADANRNLESKVKARTEELEEKNQHLAQTLELLQQTQAQLIQTEKMSSMGQLVAGMAHEINNPISFIFTNLTYAEEYTENLLRLIHVYQQTYPDATPEIAETTEDIELDYLEEDFPKILKSMHGGADRIRSIILSLRNFSRLDESEIKEVDIHEGLESSLLILQHRLENKGKNPKQPAGGIEVIKDYEKLPLVRCYAGQLNQVFMNILSNAIDALEMGYEASQTGDSKEISSHLPRPAIQIRTRVVDNSRVEISIADNGQGMTEAVRAKLFDPFFTTKPVGKGTGLGLSVSYSIVEKHCGQLRCISEPGKGSEFIVEIPLSQ
jgi:predicted ATPase/signal transduction histidine kinase